MGACAAGFFDARAPSDTKPAAALNEPMTNELKNLERAMRSQSR